MKVWLLLLVALLFDKIFSHSYIRCFPLKRSEDGAFEINVGAAINEDATLIDVDQLLITENFHGFCS